MSTNPKIPLSTAHRYACRVVQLLQPYCERIEIAGSVRREAPSIGDIEVVCIPSTVQIPDGLFETKSVRAPGFARVVNRLEKVKGDPETCKYTQRILPSTGGFKLDIFIATPDNWGLIYAIRTGSARFSHEVLAVGWSSRGFESKGGILYRRGNPYPIREEEDLFKLLGMNFIEPLNRNL